MTLPDVKWNKVNILQLLEKWLYEHEAGANVEIMQTVGLLHLFCKLTRKLYLFVPRTKKMNAKKATAGAFSFPIKCAQPSSHDKWTTYRVYIWYLTDELECASIQIRNKLANGLYTGIKLVHNVDKFQENHDRYEYAVKLLLLIIWINSNIRNISIMTFSLFSSGWILLEAILIHIK